MNCPARRIVTCYACGEQGHVRNNCPKMRGREIECIACGKHGYVRRNCPNIVCGKCNLRGHKEINCYTKMKRFSNGETNEN